MARAAKPIIRDRPFLSKSGLTGRWWLVQSWREGLNGMREAHVKHDVDDAIRQIIIDHGGDPDALPPR